MNAAKADHSPHIYAIADQLYLPITLLLQLQHSYCRPSLPITLLLHFSIPGSI